MRSSFHRLRDSIDRLRTNIDEALAGHNEPHEDPHAEPGAVADSVDRAGDAGERPEPGSSQGPSPGRSRAGSPERNPGRSSDRAGEPEAPQQSNAHRESPNPMSQSSSKVSEEFLEATQNTDPAADAVASAAEEVVVGAAGHDASAHPHAQPTAHQPPVEIRAAHAEELDRLRAERDGLVDRLARLQAEFENARRRAEREKSEFREYAVSGAVEQFLPVLDNFQLALKSTGSAEQLRTGVELIVKQMEEVLRNLNVQTVETVGVAFDPRFHEALDSVENLELPDGHVQEEIRRGYRIKERLLRPALVRVVSNPHQKPA